MYPTSVKNLLEKHNLTVVKPFRIADGGFKRSYVLLCEDKNKRKKVIKIFYSNDKYAQDRFIKEVQLLGVLSKFSIFKKFIPKVYKANINTQSPPIFYILEYFDYETFGEFTLNLGYRTGIFKKDTFEEFFKFWESLNLLNLSLPSLPRIYGSNLKLNSFGYGRFITELDYYKKQTPNILPKEKWQSIYSFIKENKEMLENARILSHLDLYPENLFEKGKLSKRFKIIDWEQAHLTAAGCNEAFLYLMFWREEYFRNRIYANYHNLCFEGVPQLKNTVGDTLNLREGKENTAVEGKKGICIFRHGGAGWRSFKSFLLLFSVRFLYQTTTYVGKSNRNYDNFQNFLRKIINDVLSSNFDKPKNLQFLLTKNWIKKVLDKFYGIKRDFSFEDLTPGYGNSMVKIDVADYDKKPKRTPYILRIYGVNRRPSLVQQEVLIYDSLNKKGFPVYKVFKNRAGKLISTAKLYGRKRYFILAMFLNGENVPRGKLTKRHVTNAAYWLRKIHNEDIIHNDFNRRNILYIGTEVSGILDFEFAKISVSSYEKKKDVAKALALWFQGIDSKASLTIDEIYKLFLNGYFKGEVPIEENEFKGLLVEQLRNVKKDYEKMYRKTPSDYFRRIIEFNRYLISHFSAPRGLTSKV